MTPGQKAYMEDTRFMPLYHDGTRRPIWDSLSEPVKWSWEKTPTVRHDVNEKKWDEFEEKVKELTGEDIEDILGPDWESKYEDYDWDAPSICGMCEQPTHACVCEY